MIIFGVSMGKEGCIRLRKLILFIIFGYYRVGIIVLWSVYVVGLYILFKFEG